MQSSAAARHCESSPLDVEVDRFDGHISERFGQLGELVYGAAPAFFKTHFFVLATIFWVLVKRSGDVPRATSFVFHRDDRGQRQPGFSGLPPLLSMPS